MFTPRNLTAKDLENRNVVGEGEFVDITVDGEHGKEVAIGPRTLEGKPGFYLISPFRLNDGFVFFLFFELSCIRTIVLVNRGWIPREMNTFTSLQSLKVRGKVKITGYIRASTSVSLFPIQTLIL